MHKNSTTAVAQGEVEARLVTEYAVHPVYEVPPHMHMALLPATPHILSIAERHDVYPAAINK